MALMAAMPLSLRYATCCCCHAAMLPPPLLLDLRHYFAAAMIAPCRRHAITLSRRHAAITRCFSLPLLMLYNDAFRLMPLFTPCQRCCYAFAVDTPLMPCAADSFSRFRARLLRYCYFRY